MTRRIALTILLTVWSMLIVGGGLAYYTTRSILLSNLDMTLMNRALSHAAQPGRDVIGQNRSLTKDDLNRTIARPTTAPVQYLPRLMSSEFSQAPENRLRTVTVRYYVNAGKLHFDPRPYTTTSSESVRDFDALLDRLLVALVGFGIVGGLLAAAVAWWASKSALKALAATADQVGTIDERHLDRRIDITALPTELTPMAERLNEMLARLQDAFALRNRFLADASHELRTPVASLMTTLDVALNRPRDLNGYRKVLESCRADTSQFRHLVERLMEQVRSQNLSYDEPIQSIDVGAVLTQCADTIWPLAEVKELTLRRDFPAIMCFAVARDRFRSIVLNLLSNAVEYCPNRGLVELNCRCDERGLNLYVNDFGAGIAPVHLPHLFEPFYRADPSRQRNSGHLGLGLSLVQSHVQSMNGHCKVESTLGSGTRVSIFLPRTVQTGLATEAVTMGKI